MIGQTISHYRIIEKLGGGGMGIVYRAEDTRLHRTVALKFLPDELARDPESLARFQREAEAASALNHPNICTIHDIGEENGKAFIAMELLEGQTMQCRIGAKPLATDLLLELGIQLADALDAAHTKGIVHRDIKPGNIFVTTRGQAKILDFGLAKKIAQKAAGAEALTASLTEEQLTRPGGVFGTLAYMSPEQARGEDLDARSDLFSFGAVLYEMATGRQPFQGATSAIVLDGIFNRAPIAPSKLNRRLPPFVEQTICKTLEKDRELRTQSAAELRADLKKCFRRNESTVPMAYLAHHRRWVAAVLSLVAIALLISIWFFKPAPLRRLGRSIRLTNANITMDGGMVTDGSRLYFLMLSGEKTILAQVSTSGGEPTLLSIPGPVAYPFDISPDGSQLLLGSGVQTPLRIQPIVGGAAYVLGEAKGDSAGFSPDGQRFVYSRPNELDIANRDGSDIHRIVGLEGQASRLRWSPDGKFIRFTHLTAQGHKLWEVASDGSHLGALFPDWNEAEECCGNWTTDGKDYVFASNRGGAGWNLWAVGERLSLFGHRAEPVQLTDGPMDFFNPVPSRDGKKLFALGEQSQGELLAYDSKKRTFVPFLSGISAESVNFSRDGTWTAYVSYPEGSLWRSRADGSDRVRLTLPPMLVALPRWSPDGKWIAFMGNVPGKSMQSYLIAAEGGPPQQIIPGDHHYATPGWSPDGKKLVVADWASDENQRQVHIWDLQTKQLTTLPDSRGLHFPIWSPEGRYIAATSDEKKSRLYDLTNQQWAELPPISNWAWSHDGHYIYSLEETGISRVRLRDRKVENVTNLNGFTPAAGVFGIWFGLTPDDKPILLRSLSSQNIYAFDWDDTLR